MTDYVVGFMREALSDRVLMIRKSKPVWQAGLLNGVGGKVDQQVAKVPPRAIELCAVLTGKPESEFQKETRLETPLEAMVREFEEETGIVTNPDEWRLIMYMRDPRDFYAKDNGTVYWFAATRRFLPTLPARTRDANMDELTTVRVSEVANRSDVLASVRWTIPMAFLDPTLAVLGSDDDVLAQARAATVRPKFDSRKFIEDTIQKHRDPPMDTLRERIARKAAHRDRVELGQSPSWTVGLRGELSAEEIKAGKAPAWMAEAVAEHVRASDEMKTSPVTGCKLKFVHPIDTKLCECADVCMGTGMSPDNVRLAGVNEAAQAKIILDQTEWNEANNPNRLKAGDFVVNKSGSERGRIICVDGASAWVQSNDYASKRVSLYLVDLARDVNQYAKLAAGIASAPTMIDRSKLWATGGLIKGKSTGVAEVGRIKGVVEVNGEFRQHNGKSLGNVVTKPTYAAPGSIDTSQIRDAMHKIADLPKAPPYPGEDGKSYIVAKPSHVPDEPSEVPDAPWRGTGGSRNSLSPMQEQRVRSPSIQGSNGL